MHTVLHDCRFLILENIKTSGLRMVQIKWRTLLNFRCSPLYKLIRFISESLAEMRI